MSVNHKFMQNAFSESFSTNHAILSVTPYEPEILFIGTFNPDTRDKVNIADFYYGRNWFWPALYNIIKYGNCHYSKQRKFYSPLDPSIVEILDFCKEYKLTFADLIDKVLFKDNTDYELIGNKVKLNNKEYDLINDGDLGKLNNLSQVSWTTSYLINYLKVKTTIKTVYITRNPVEPYKAEWNNIISTNYGREISFRKIFTPSGQGLKGTPRIQKLINHWIFNDNSSYDQIDRDWLNRLNVNINIFL